jgi:hypothetical protein
VTADGSRPATTAAVAARVTHPAAVRTAVWSYDSTKCMSHAPLSRITATGTATRDLLG